MSEILGISDKIAIKEHKCDLCGRIIPVGTKYECEHYVQNGRIYTWRTCQQCLDLLNRYPLEDDMGDGIDYYDFYDHVAKLCKKLGIDATDLDVKEMVDALLLLPR
ncbi:MAG: hypothetical protein WC248_04560 [Candidatus Methanomethylophilaceae archaeon]